jgi:hypothetical protein
MKANELRIGNLVLDRGGKILTIDRFYGNKIECDVKGMPDKDPLTSTPIYYHPLTEEIEYLQPIPLTEEWLLKFGFEKHITIDTYPTFAKQMFNWNDSILYVIGYGFINHIKYVHQLQNLYYALTNEELI